ncbi:uncharacterized protein LOC143553938 [Bidens hawaiensis]|uniref:uncharacterized protein LOC143553938 n=1 Tax=Bidens hawaiensis TaxID=980011 RepID=UPI0040491A2B
MYEQSFEQFDEEDKARLKPIHAPVSGFGYEIMHPRGVISFPVTLSDGIHSRTEDVEFLVLLAKSKHDIILGREAIGDFNAHPSTAHGTVGVSTRIGIEIICINMHCFTTESSKASKIPKQIERTEPDKWVLNKKFPDQTITIGPAISEIVRTFLKHLLTKNMDIFAWKPQTLLYQTWVANPVIVPKNNETWRMCIDFKDLNKAFQKDCYPLPEIELEGDAVVPFKFKCFIDAYKGYHQIRMVAGAED